MSVSKQQVAHIDAQIAGLDSEQLPVPNHKLHGGGHFAGLYAAEHVAGTEFVFGATFVALGASLKDVLIGLIIGNTLAVLSYWLVTTPIAIQSRISLYTYLSRVASGIVPRLYNLANAVIFAVISAAMITVSATAVRRIVGIPAQEQGYPTHMGFVIIALVFALVAVAVAAFGFNALAEFASICGPWLMVMFTVGGMVLIPAVAESVTGYTTLTSWGDFVNVASSSVFIGVTPEGAPGISIWGIIGFAWAANTFSHFGLIDMALLRYARKQRYGLATATGMMFGHYVAWISAGMMGAATAAVMLTSITVVEPGDVAWHALGFAGYVTVIVAGWTTANANLYRAGLAAHAVVPKVSRVKVTLIVGAAVMIASCFPFIYKNFLPLVTYCGVLLVPIGGIIFAEHHLFKRMGLTKFWARYKGVSNTPALISWGLAIAVGFGLPLLNLMPYYYAFIPAWFISIVAYVWLAKRAGAAEKYPEEEAADKLFDERVEVFHAEQAATEPAHAPKDRSAVGMVLKAVWIISLIVTVVLAWRVLFNSPDMFTYLVQRETFYLWAGICTAIYFVAAYGGLQWKKYQASKWEKARVAKEASLK